MTAPEATTAHQAGEHWWPMALAVLSAGCLRLALPPELRNHDARWALLPVLVVLLAVLVVGDPGRIDRQKTWLRVLLDVLISIITLVNATAAARLTTAIVQGAAWTNNAKVILGAGAAVWFTNVIAFALWYWDLDRGGPAARALGTGPKPAFIFPEMTLPEYVPAGWSPRFSDYFHLSFTTATAFSPTDTPAVRVWAKWVMMAQESISLVVALLVVARAVNILK
ncbi:MAG TPA: hypothetical protein VGZ03_08940 [Acidimicrobiales bacterium]|nr:hypothetical protein [Acidimicrobiales bacterium]